MKDSTRDKAQNSSDLSRGVEQEEKLLLYIYIVPPFFLIVCVFFFRFPVGKTINIFFSRFAL